MLNKLIFHFGFLLFIILFSCTKREKSTMLDEGFIDFDIAYPLIPKTDIRQEFFPHEMEFVFKNNSYRNNIKAGFGIFSTSFINNRENKSITQTLKFLNTKYVTSYPSKEMVNDPDFREVSIRFLDGEKMIAGYKCKMAEITLSGDTSWSHIAYYTNDIKVENPNKHTSYHEIDGVLMDYQMMKYGTRIHFIATKVSNKKLKESIVKVDDDYETVSAERLGTEIKNIFAKLN